MKICHFVPSRLAKFRMFDSAVMARAPPGGGAVHCGGPTPKNGTNYNSAKKTTSMSPKLSAT